jgi:hypothetical protein
VNLRGSLAGMQYPVPTRRRRSALEVRQLLVRFQQSGLSQAEFVRREGLCLSTLQRYLKRLRSSSKGAAPSPQKRTGAVSFLEIQPVLELPSGGRPPAAHSQQNAPYRLVFTGGAVLEIPSGFGHAEAQFLMRLALNTLSQ